MDKEQILTKIQDCGIVAVVRAESADQASRIADACRNNILIGQIIFIVL